MCCLVFNLRATSTGKNTALVAARQGWGILSLRWALSQTNEWRLLSWNHTWTTVEERMSGREWRERPWLLANVGRVFQKKRLLWLWTHTAGMYTVNLQGIHTGRPRQQHLRVAQKLNQHRAYSCRHETKQCRRHSQYTHKHTCAHTQRPKHSLNFHR